MIARSSALAQEGDAPVDSGEASVESFDEPFAEPFAEPPELPEADETEGRLEREGETPPPAEPHPDNLIWTLAAGGLLNYGNARTAGLNVSSSFGLRHGAEVVVVEGSFQYAVAQPPLSCGSVQLNPSLYAMGTVDFCGPSGTGMTPRARAPGFNDWTETAVNLSWRVRWDHFTDPFNVFFLGHRGRVDRFGGVRPRISLNLGYSRVVFDEHEHLLSFDFGLDATFDFFTDAIRAQNEDTLARGNQLPVFSYADRRFVPSVLVGVTYVNHINPYLTYDTNLQALWDTANQTHFRFEWVNHLRSAINETFQIRLDVTARLDGLPPGQLHAWVEDPTIQTTTMFDIFTALNLVGTLDLDGPSLYASSLPEAGRAQETEERPHGTHREDAQRPSERPAEHKPSRDAS